MLLGQGIVSRDVETAGGAGLAHGHVYMAIIGAGPTGLSTALHLARKGANVQVLGKGTVGSGASGRSGGRVTKVSSFRLELERVWFRPTQRATPKQD
ncbi:FAD-dependent oxidoreductase [Streptomyces sp. NPDC015127]|uniref:FAD-dependent oxidoreductase n=1 Tax=Streptomyces sp. NPDC015127 TaxID=3364939 RepID=UPI0036F62913